MFDEPTAGMSVDEVPVILDLIADTLGEDFAVTPVPTVEAALTLTEKIDFDLILSDLRLADGPTGIDFYESIMEKTPKLAERFVFMTGDTLGQSSRVLMMCFSEFGRRLKENASKGTDHGAAAPMFLLGDSVKPGIHGAMPSLTDLDQGDLKHHTDFRQVYATVLEKWMQTASQPLLGAGFPALPLLRV